MLDSPVADMKNTGGRWGGGSAAALVAQGVHCGCPLGAPGHTRARQDQKGRTLPVGGRHRVRGADPGATRLTDGEQLTLKVELLLRCSDRRVSAGWVVRGA